MLAACEAWGGVPTGPVALPYESGSPVPSPVGHGRDEFPQGLRHGEAVLLAPCLKLDVLTERQPELDELFPLVVRDRCPRAGRTHDARRWVVYGRTAMRARLKPGSNGRTIVGRSIREQLREIRFQLRCHSCAC